MALADPDANTLPSSPELSDEEHFSMHSDKDTERGSQLTSEGKPNGTQTYEVGFGENLADPEDIARHMGMARRYYISSVITFTSMVITMVSSCWTCLLYTSRCV